MVRDKVTSEVLTRLLRRWRHPPRVLNGRCDARYRPDISWQPTSQKGAACSTRDTLSARLCELDRCLTNRRSSSGLDFLCGVADSVFSPADRVLDLALCFVSHPAGLGLLVASHLANGLLYGSLRLISTSRNSIPIHCKSPCEDVTEATCGGRTAVSWAMFPVDCHFDQGDAFASLLLFPPPETPLWEPPRPAFYAKSLL